MGSFIAIIGFLLTGLSLIAIYGLFVDKGEEIPK